MSDQENNLKIKWPYSILVFSLLICTTHWPPAFHNLYKDNPCPIIDAPNPEGFKVF